jgi:hypothetical protein
MNQPYTVRDEAYGRVHDYSATAPTVTPRGDNISHSYAPPNHDTARGWAFDDALEACVASTMLGIVLAFGAAFIAVHLALGLLGILLVMGGGFVAPFLWPFAFWWRSPYMAYRRARWKWQGVVTEYHEAAIERLRPQASPTPAPTVAGARTATPEPGEMFYLQCAAVLARATVDPRSPRDAESAVKMATKSGSPIVVTKDDYDTVAGMLCELGFMVGGKGQTPRNYALAQAWQGKSVNELWAALKPHKATIKAWAV